MINSITVTNHLNQSITMELRFPEKSGFLIQRIDGLSPNKADINMSEMVPFDGNLFDSARIQPRNIVFDIAFLPNPTIEDSRQKSYKYFPIKRRIKIQIEASNRICEIYGYVESNEADIFSKTENAIISIICPDPYLYDVMDQTTLFSAITPLFEFPFENNSTSQKLIEFCSVIFNTEKNIVYNGDLEIGLVIHIHAIGVATDVVIIDSDTLEEIGINSTRLVALTGEGIHSGDDIYISTVRGHKYVTLHRDGNIVNILNCLEDNPDWLAVDKGDNLFAYDAATGLTNLQFEIINKIAYEGV